MWWPMDHHKWCVVAVAFMSIENHESAMLVNAFESAVREGIVFA